MAYVALKNGAITLVDEDDLDRVLQTRWTKNRAGYATGTVNGVNHQLHRFILNCQKNDGLIIDHINRDKLDNRKMNLRFVTPKQNRENIGITLGRIIRIKHITMPSTRGFIRREKQYEVLAKIKEKQILLGSFDDFFDATAKCAKLREYFEDQLEFEPSDLIRIETAWKTLS